MSTEEEQRQKQAPAINREIISTEDQQQKQVPAIKREEITQEFLTKYKEFLEKSNQNSLLLTRTRIAMLAHLVDNEYTDEFGQRVLSEGALSSLSDEEYEDLHYGLEPKLPAEVSLVKSGDKFHYAGILGDNGILLSEESAALQKEFIRMAGLDEALLDTSIKTVKLSRAVVGACCGLYKLYMAPESESKLS